MHKRHKHFFRPLCRNMTTARLRDTLAGLRADRPVARSPYGTLRHGWVYDVVRAGVARAELRRRNAA